MKKKIIPIVTALACAFTTATALIACGDDEDQKFHSEAQWTAAFDAVLATKDYKIQQGEWKEFEADDGSVYAGYNTFNQVYYDAVDNIYREEFIMPDDIIARTVAKHGSRYYNIVGNFGEPISQSDFNQAKGYFDEFYDDLIQRLFTDYRNEYNKFSIGGSGYWGINDDYTYYHNYILKNESFTIRRDDNGTTVETVYSIETVDVTILDEGGLHEVKLTGITSNSPDDDSNMEFIYMPGSGLKEYWEMQNIQYPEVLGMTYVFDNVDFVGTVPESVRETAYQMQAAIHSANQDKRITCNADGSLTTDIVFDDVKLSDFTLTEGDNGALTITYGDISFDGECRIDRNRSFVVIEFISAFYIDEEVIPVKFTFRQMLNYELNPQ